MSNNAKNIELIDDKVEGFISHPDLTLSTTKSRLQRRPCEIGVIIFLLLLYLFMIFLSLFF